MTNHTTTAPQFDIEQLRSTIPGYAAATDQLAQLAKVPMPVARAASPVDQARNDVLAALAAGDDVAAMILPAAEQAVADVEAVIVARAALARARQELEAQRHTAITDNADVILAGLHDALTEVVDEVRALEPLDQIGTESAAVASDRTTDMKRLRAVGVTYAKIRAEQIRVLEHHLGGPIGEHSLAAFLARPLDAFPEYAEWMREDRIAPPWPIRGDYSDALGARGIATGRGQVVRDASTEAFLAWAVAADVDLTVPSLDEFQTAAAQLHTAVHADDDERRRELGARPVTATIRI